MGSLLPLAILLSGACGAFILGAASIGVASEAGPGRHRREALACSAAAMTAAIVMVAVASHPIFWGR